MSRAVTLISEAERNAIDHTDGGRISYAYMAGFLQAAVRELCDELAQYEAPPEACFTCDWHGIPVQCHVAYEPAEFGGDDGPSWDESWELQAVYLRGEDILHAIDPRDAVDIEEQCIAQVKRERDEACISDAMREAA